MGANMRRRNRLQHRAIATYMRQTTSASNWDSAFWSSISIIDICHTSGRSPAILTVFYGMILASCNSEIRISGCPNFWFVQRIMWGKYASSRVYLARSYSWKFSYHLSSATSGIRTVFGQPGRPTLPWHLQTISNAKVNQLGHYAPICIYNQ